MTRREHVVGLTGLAIVVASAWHLVATQGAGALGELAFDLLLIWCAIKAGGWVADRTYRSRRRRDALQARADAIGREHELAVAVIEQPGSRYLVTAQHWRLGAGGPEDAFAAGASSLEFEHARAYIEGLDDGHALADWRASHPHNRGENRE